MAEKTEVRFAGSGGHGVILAAQILAKAAVLDGKYVVQTQAYGAEARGSLAKSEVIISGKRIGFPAVRHCDVLVAMSSESLVLANNLKPEGILIIDSTSITTTPETKVKALRFPIAETAKKLFNDPVYSNMVMLGVFIGVTNLVSPLAVESTIRQTVSKKMIENNVKAFNQGLALSKKQS